jgi:uncharacterized protein (DUF58 family)
VIPVALTGRAVVAAVIGAAVVFVAPLGGITVLLVAVALAGLVAVDLALAASPLQVTVARSGETSTRLGEPIQVRTTLTPGGERPLRGTVRDAWPPSADASPRRWDVQADPGEHIALTTTLVPRRRGRRDAAGLTIRALGPLGLAGRQRTVAAPWSVRVLPAFASRRILPDKLARLRELDGSVVAAVRGQGSEFDSLRSYVDGDDARSIDWRASARRAEVVVRTWRPERDRQVMLVLDTGRTSAGRVAGAPRLEANLDAILLLAALARRAGDRVGLLAQDQRVRARVELTRQGEVLPSIMRATADLEPVLVETDIEAIGASLLGRLRRRSLVVWFTALPAGGADTTLVPTLAALLRRHTVLVGAVSDPRIDELAGERSDAPAAYAAAAAEAARAEQRRTASTLRRLGAIVVSGPPDTFASAVADAYLDLKAAGRL